MSSRSPLAVALAGLFGLASCVTPRMPLDAQAEDAAGIVTRCDQVAFAPEGTPCALRDPCREETGCCTQAWSCEDGHLTSARECAPTCFRSCEDALATGAPGDPCETSFFCSSFSPDLCCTHSVECAAGRLVVTDECTPECPAS